MKIMWSSHVLPICFVFSSLIHCQEALAADPVSCTVQRIDCKGGESRFHRLDGMNGFGPTNLVVRARTNYDTGLSFSGYVVRPSFLESPSAVKGFRRFSCQIKQSNRNTKLTDGRVVFLFQFAPNGPLTTVEKSFAQLHPSGGSRGNEVKTLTADPSDFQSNVGSANLVKFWIYIKSRVIDELYLGEYSVESGQGRYITSVVKTDSGGCDLPPQADSF